MKNKKFLSVLIISIIAIMLIALCSCELPVEEVDEDAIYATKAYSLVFSEGTDTYRLELDGNKNCQMFRSSNYDLEFSPNNLAAFVTDSKDDFCNVTTYSFKIAAAPFLATTRAILYKDGTIDTLANQTKNSSKEAYDLLKDIPLDKVFTYKYDDIEEGGVVAHYTFEIKIVSKVPQNCAYGMKKEITEYEYASGEYSINNGRFITLDYEFLQDIPTKGLDDYEIFDVASYNDNVMSEEVDNNGLIKIIYHQNNIEVSKVVQLKDDGTFEFKMSSSSSSKQTLLTSGYKGKSFTNQIIRYDDDNNRYVYDFTISFDQDGKVEFKKEKGVLRKNYYIKSEDELITTYFAIEDYNSLIGTHPTYGTDNNLAFANDYKAYVYQGKNKYTFDAMSMVSIRDYGDYYHIAMDNTHGVQVNNAGKFYFYYYKDGHYEWDATEYTFGK